MPPLPASAPGHRLFHSHLAARGAVFANGVDARFADVSFPEADPLHRETRDASVATDRSGPTIHPLAADGLIHVRGEDAAPFLQGQLSNDIGELAADRAQLTTWCTAQGRMLASMMVWQASDGYLLQLPGKLLDAVLARMRRYILRSRVQLADASEATALIGVAGSSAHELLRGTLGEPPVTRMQSTRPNADTVVICLDRDLYQVAVPDNAAGALWDRLSVASTPAGTAAWAWHLIHAQIPVITAATQDQFVPQMANMEQLGAISFGKGCYPGQEIVARAQYRGQVKRRLYRLHASRGPAPPAGTQIYTTGSDASVGTVLNAALAPTGGCDMLAVLQVEAADRADLRLASAEGERLARSD